MFRQLVANLPFSPALIGQLGFYARRLRQEELTRRLGLIFTALALVVQSFAVFNPPEAQATASRQNIIFQGVRSKEDLLSIYDRNVDAAGNRDIQQIYTYYGVTRDDIVRASTASFNSREQNLGIWSVGRNSYDAGTQYEQAHAIPGTSSTTFARKLWRFDKLPYTQKNGSNYKGVVGKRAVDGKWFAISFDCGNIAFTDMPPKPVVVKTPVITTPPKKPVSTKPVEEVDKGVATFTTSKTVANQTLQLLDANNSTARPDDRLLYTLYVKNSGTASAEYTVKENISDVLEYADITDAGGGRVDAASGTISWDSTIVQPGQTLTKTIQARLKTDTPASPQNAGNPESYNCIITNSFGNATNVKVECPPTKVVENTVKELPATGPTENIVFSAVLLMVVTYFFARSRQVSKEVKLIRHDFNLGTI